MTVKPSKTQTARAQSPASVWVLAIVSSTSIVAISLILLPEVRHWFMTPVLVCGILIMPDAWAALLGRRDFFDPQSIVGLFGTHFFFLAPILHFVFDFWPLYVAPAADWRFSFGILCSLNAVGLLAYRLVLPASGEISRGPDGEKYEPGVRTFISLAIMGALMGALAFAVVLAKFGGFSGYISTVTNRDARVALGGSGWLLIIAESFPLLLLVALLLRRRLSFALNNTPALLLLFALFVVAQFAIGGLRGSRSNTVWPVLIAAAIIHLTVRKIRITTILLGSIALFVFMFGYGLYKGAGTEALGVLEGDRSLTSVSNETGRGYEFLLLEDLGRTGIQGLVVDRYTRASQAPAFGATYLGDLSILVPTGLLSKENRPPSKVEIGSDVLYGSGAARIGLYSSRIYGLGGEAMLNFGLMAVPIAYIVYALIVRKLSLFYRGASASGSPLHKVVASTTGVLSIMLLTSDLDNLAWFTMKQIVPIVAIATIAYSATARRDHKQGRPEDTLGSNIRQLDGGPRG